MKVKVPSGMSSMIVKRMLLAMKKHPYFSVQAQALGDVAVQLMCAGDSAELGQSMGMGVVKGLGEESREKHPRCPRCGRRHPPVAAMKIRRPPSFGPI